MWCQPFHLRLLDPSCSLDCSYVLAVEHIACLIQALQLHTDEYWLKRTSIKERKNDHTPWIMNKFHHGRNFCPVAMPWRRSQGWSRGGRELYNFRYMHFRESFLP